MTKNEANTRGREHYRAGRALLSQLDFQLAIVMLDPAMSLAGAELRLEWFRGYTRETFGVGEIWVRAQ